VKGEQHVFSGGRSTGPDVGATNKFLEEEGDRTPDPGLCKDGGNNQKRKTTRPKSGLKNQATAEGTKINRQRNTSLTSTGGTSRRKGKGGNVHKKNEKKKTEGGL